MSNIGIDIIFMQSQMQGMIKSTLIYASLSYIFEILIDPSGVNDKLILYSRNLNNRIFNIFRNVECIASLEILQIFWRDINYTNSDGIGNMVIRVVNFELCESATIRSKSNVYYFTRDTEFELSNRLNPRGLD